MLRPVQRALLLVFLSCLFITSGSSKAQKEPEKNYIKVKGVGMVSRDPDMVYLNLSITTLEKNAKEAYETNVKKSNDLIEASKKIGLSPDDFKNSFSLSESHDRQGKRIGFSATNSLKVALDDLDLVTKLVDISADFVTGSDIRFGLKDYKKANLEALDSALIDAKTKATALAEKAGLKLGETISIDEAPEYSWGFLGGFGGSRADEVLRTQVGGVYSSPLTLNPQKINVISNIVVIFEVKSK
ncbi:MAG: SIMPL domain-containing protein [candidate division Zixibacteria bacterium]|nr:SIMPL domain-containing protein [candidate division Zixibacteria bacterium]